MRPAVPRKAVLINLSRSRQALLYSRMQASLITQVRIYAAASKMVEERPEECTLAEGSAAITESFVVMLPCLDQWLQLVQRTPQ